MTILTYFYYFPNVYLKGNVHNNFVILSLLIGASASHSENFLLLLVVDHALLKVKLKTHISV